MNFALPGHHFGGPQGWQNDAQGTQKGAKMMPGEPKSRKMNPGAPKGGPMRKRPKKHRKYDFEDPLHFDTFSLKNEKKSKSDCFLETWSRQTFSVEISLKPGSPEPLKCD